MTDSSDHLTDESATHYALGLLDEHPAQQLETHASSCRPCADRVRVAVDAVAAAELEMPLHALPADLRHDVLAAATAPPMTSESASPVVARRRRPRRCAPAWGRWRPGVAHAPLLAAASCTLVLAFVAVDQQSRLDRQERHIDRMENDPRLAVLRGASLTQIDTDGPFGDARATVAIEDDSGVVVLRNVPKPQRGTVWQVWQVDEDDRIASIGTINTSRTIAFLPLQDIDKYELQRIIVTAEPAGGSSQPNDDPVGGTVV